MKKTGDRRASEKARFVLAHGLFLLLITLSLIFVMKTHGPSITGFAVYDSSEAQQLLETAIESSSFFEQVPQTNFCVMIKGGEEVHSLDITKSGSSAIVRETRDMCDGVEREDLIVKFNSYDDFKEIMENPSTNAIMSGRAGEKYYILESKFVEKGGNVLCDEIFKERFCGAALQFGTSEQLIEGDLSCCLGKLTAAQQKLLDEHLGLGEFADETVAKPEKTFLTITNLIAFLFIIIIVFITVAGTINNKRHKQMTMKKAEEVLRTKTESLKKYIHDALDNGYSATQIEGHLKENGWEENILSAAFTEVHHERHIAKTYKP